MTQREKSPLLRGIACMLACVLTFMVGGTAFAEKSPEVQWERVLNIDNYPYYFEAARNGGFIKAEVKGTELLVHRISPAGELNTSVLPNHTELSDVVGFTQTEDGAFLLAGIKPVFGESQSQLRVVKIDADGQILWQYATNHLRWGNAAYIRVTNDGGTVVAATTRSWEPETWGDIYLLKLSPDGSKQWEHVMGGTVDDTVRALTVTRDGGVVIIADRLVSGKIDQRFNYDLYAAKFDSAGSLVWERQQETGGTTKGWGVIETRDGGVILTGSDGAIWYEPDVSYAGYMLKLNGKGMPLWEKKLPASLNISNAHEIQEDSNGNLILAASVNYRRFNMGTRESDGYLLKMDPTGKLIWEKVLEGGDHTVRTVDKVQLTPDGGYLALGGRLLTKLMPANEPAPSSLQFDSEDYSVVVGQTLDVHLYLQNGNTRTEVTSEAQYEFTDPTIASIDKAGNIIGLKKGTTGLKGSYQGNTVTSRVYVYPVNEPTPSSLQFDSEDYSVVVGQALDVHLYLQNGRTRTEVTSDAQYEFTDPAIASIDSAGNIVGLKKGTTGLKGSYQGKTVTSAVYVY